MDNRSGFLSMVPVSSDTIVHCPTSIHPSIRLMLVALGSVKFTTR